MGRRRFLIAGAAALAAGAAALGWALLGGARSRARREAVARLAGRVGDSAAVRDLGRAYLATAPEEADPEALAALLASDLGASWGRLGTDRLQRSFRDRVRRDFEQGRVVMVEQWMLSLTELRLCALASLL